MTSRKPEEPEEALSELPSTLFAFWPEAEPPLEEEIRLALDAAFPGLAATEELDAEDGMLWGTVYRIPEHESEYVVWVQERSEVPDEFVEDAIVDPAEREAAVRARWFIGVETLLNPRQALADFQTQLRVVEAVSVPGLVAVYDDNALVVRPGKQVRELVRSSVPPRPATLYAIHEMEGKAGMWLHTHGLVRLGIPEIELLGLNPSDVQEGYDLIDAVVDVIFGGGEPDSEGAITVGEDMEVRLVAFKEALSILPAEVVASRSEHEVEEEDHRDPRIVILARERNDTPHELLERLRNDAVLFKSREETDRQRSLAIERFGIFGQLFAIRRNEGWRFHAKLGFSREGDPRVREHVWFEVRELKPGQLRGICLNEPVDGLPFHEGDEGWFKLDLLTDWLVVSPEGNFDPEAAPILLAEE
jgi:hypothetical protein